MYKKHGLTSSLGQVKFMEIFTGRIDEPSGRNKEGHYLGIGKGH